MDGLRDFFTIYRESLKEYPDVLWEKYTKKEAVEEMQKAFCMDRYYARGNVERNREETPSDDFCRSSLLRGRRAERNAAIRLTQPLRIAWIKTQIRQRPGSDLQRNHGNGWIPWARRL